MDFKLPTTGKPRNLDAGDKVNFEFFVDPEGLPQITRIYPSTNTPESKAAVTKAAGNKP
jgi:Cu(I)/Ag(I) efflux system membrane fusion protein